MDPGPRSHPLVTLAPADLAIIALFAAAVMLIGFRASRRPGGTADFLLAGRSLTLPVFVMTLVSTWYGGILGVGEFSYLYGLSNWFIQGFPYYVFSALFAFFLAQRVHRAGYVTIPDKLEAAYGRPTALLGGALTFLLMTPAPYILMLGILVQLVTGWSLLVCLFAGTVASTAYLLTGGFKADVATDVFEFVVMFLGFAVIIPYGALQYGGFHSSPHICRPFISPCTAGIQPHTSLSGSSSRSGRLSTRRSISAARRRRRERSHAGGSSGRSRSGLSSTR
jgi:SSS family solute:Na+ symporter